MCIRDSFHTVPDRICLIIQMPIFLLALVGRKRIIMHIHMGNQLRNHTNNKLFLWHLKKADLAIVILDGSREMESEDIKLLDAASKTPSILLVNKRDLPQNIKLNEISKEYKNILYTSKEDEESLARVKEAISKIIESSDLDPSIPVLANERQRDCLQRSLSELEKLEELPSIDLVGVLLESAMEPLFELTGERVQESVVDKIFSEFCVGK